METTEVITTENDTDIEPIFVGQCPSLSEKSTLTFEIGQHKKNHTFHLRIAANTGGGMFCDEWAEGPAIDLVLATEESLVSRTFNALHEGRSINTGGFVLAVLKHLGLVEINPENSRQHRSVEGSSFDAACQRAAKQSNKGKGLKHKPSND